MWPLVKKVGSWIYNCLFPDQGIDVLGVVINEHHIQLRFRIFKPDGIENYCWDFKDDYAGPFIELLKDVGWFKNHFLGGVTFKLMPKECVTHLQYVHITEVVTNDIVNPQDIVYTYGNITRRSPHNHNFRKSMVSKKTGTLDLALCLADFEMKAIEAKSWSIWD